MSAAPDRRGHAVQRSHASCSSSVRVVLVADRRTGCRRRARDRRSTPLVVAMLRCRLPHHIDTTSPPPAPAAATPTGRDSHPHVPPDQRPVPGGAGDHTSAHGSPGRLRAPDEVATTSRLPNRDAARALRRSDARPAPRGTADHDHVRRRVSRRLLQGCSGAHRSFACRALPTSSRTASCTAIGRS